MISIIVPVYNAEKYIDRCINSIITQSVTDIELILVDDGSPDSCPEICDNWAKKDSRIKALHKKNGGVSSARNCGLDAVSGDLVTFVDSDDTLPDGALGTMAQLMADDIDFVICSHNEVKLNPKAHIEKEQTFKAQEIKTDKFIEFDETTWWPWGKMFRADIIKENNIRFDTNLTFGEDHAFNLLYAKNITGKVCVSSKIAYNYYTYTVGLCAKFYPDYHKIQKYIYFKIVDFFGNIPRRYEKYYIGAYFAGVVDYYLYSCKMNEAKKYIREAYDVYTDILDDEILAEHFTQKQIEMLKSGNINKFATDYTLKNPDKTAITKIKKRMRKIIEKSTEMIKN